MTISLISSDLTIFSTLLRNMAPNQPRDNHGRWSTTGGSHSTPHSTNPAAPLNHPLDMTLSNGEKLSFVKHLPGSTQPKLFKDASGKKWVIKSTGVQTTQGITLTKDHLQNELSADRAYEALGAKVPKGELVRENLGGYHKKTEFLEGAQTYSDWQVGKSEAQKNKIKGKIADRMLTDALLMNYDAVGMTQDNVMIHQGEVYRIDNGGALKYRAQGAHKPGFSTPPNLSPDGNLASVKEMLTSHKANAKDIYNDGLKELGGTTPPEALLKGQAYVLASKKDALLNSFHDPETKKVVKARLEALEAHYFPAQTPAKSTLPTPAPVVAPTPSIPTVKVVNPTPTAPRTKSTRVAGDNLDTGHGLATHVSNGYKFTPLMLDVITVMNPNGVKDGVFYTYPYGTKKKNDEVKEHLSKVLPPGTIIKVAKNPTKPQVEAIKAGLPHDYILPGSGKIKGKKETKVATPATPKTSTPPRIPHPTVRGLVVNPDTLKVADATGVHLSHSKVSVDVAHMYAAHPKGSVKDGDKITLPSFKRTQEFKDVHEAWRKTLTPAEQSLVQSWKSDSGYIRKKIREEIEDSEKTNTPLNPKGKAKMWMDIMAKHPAQELVGYRGLGNNKYDPKERAEVQAKLDHFVAQAIKAHGTPGGIFIADELPHGLSLSAKTSGSFATNTDYQDPVTGKMVSPTHPKEIMLRIHGKGVFPIIEEGTHSYEKEVIGKPGAKYRVVGYAKDVSLDKGWFSGSDKVRHFIDLEEV